MPAAVSVSNRPPLSIVSWLATHALGVGLFVSLFLHAFVMATEFRLPEKPPMTRKDEGLKVVLVNARHAQAPEKADVLAQASLEGGGQTDQDHTPTSPLPPQESRQEGQALVETQKASPERPQAVHRAILTQSEPGAPASPPDARDLPDSEAASEVSGLDLMNNAAAIARVEASIERRLEELSKRPRRRFIGARAREYRFAQYVEDWRQKVEKVGTVNYPDSARGKLYGNVLVLVAIRADGSVERSEVRRSSGSPVLDEAALRIVHLAAPYAEFPPDVREDTDIIEIVRTWSFTSSDRFVAQ
jgi:periplasmic protein TonB